MTDNFRTCYHAPDEDTALTRAEARANALSKTDIDCPARAVTEAIGANA